MHADIPDCVAQQLCLPVLLMHCQIKWPSNIFSRSVVYASCRPACSPAAAAETPDADASAVACTSKPDNEAQGVQPEAAAVSGNAREGLRRLAELDDRAQPLDIYPDPDKDR